jgi:ABC-type transport system substrate-binding protein
VLDKWQVLMNQQMPTNFLTMDDTLTAYSSNLHGVVYTDLGTFYPWEWYFTKK